MSRSYNQKSCPIQRGRLGVKKVKRRSSKKIRRQDTLNGRIDKILRKSFKIDK